MQDKGYLWQVTEWESSSRTMEKLLPEFAKKILTKSVSNSKLDYG